MFIVDLNTLSDTKLMPTPETDTRFFGHPRGLATLFLTEMGERFNFYGVRGLLILFMTASVASGGLGFDVKKAAMIYGLYMSSVYLLSLPGGWIADRLLGARRSVLYGGILISAGAFCLLSPSLTAFYLGLLIIVLGTGLLKPNVSTIVGMLYPPGDHRRDAGFSIFYMGINLGAVLASLICGWVGQKVNWHLGLALGGVGMLLAVVQFALQGKYLGNAGNEVTHSQGARRNALIAIIGGCAAVALLFAVLRAAHIDITPSLINDAFGVGLLGLSVVMFAWLIFGPGWSPIERKRFVAILVLFIASSLFWAAYEQAGSTMSLFAEHSTRKDILGFNYPASWFQSLNSFFIIAFAPAFAWLWIKLGRRDPSSPAKFALGLFLIGLGFVVLVPAAFLAQNGQVSSLWLTASYLFQTFGELSLSPVGLSAMTKLAPARVVSLMMGIWFVTISVGEYVGGRLAAFYVALAPPTLFAIVAAFSIGAAIVLFFLIKPTVRLMSGVK